MSSSFAWLCSAAWIWLSVAKLTVEVADKTDVAAEDDSGWTTVELHDTGIDEIEWKDHLQFYWNTPILSASSDPDLHPMLQNKIFPDLHEILKLLPQTDNRFGDLLNISDVLSLLETGATDAESTDKQRNIHASFSKFIHVYKKRLVSWMALYSRGQCVVDADLDSMYLLVLSPGEIIPLHGVHNFAVNNEAHEHHDLISVLSIQPEEFYAQNEGHDGLFIYDPRGTVSGYGFANIFIHTSQSEQLNTRGGYLHIFPSGLKFHTLPVEYTRVFLVSFANLYSVHQPYRRSGSGSSGSSDSDAVIPIYHLQDAPSTYVAKNDEPFFDQNIQLFSAFGTPIFRSRALDAYQSLSVPALQLDAATFAMLSKCFTHYASRTQSVRKSNRNGWQSTADILRTYKTLQWMVGEHAAHNTECVAAIDTLYAYIVEQVSLWLLSFSNSYYFDDNGLIINFQTMNDNKIYVDVVDSWININKNAAMNVPHSHPNSDLSGIVYIDIPKKNADVDVVGAFDGDLFFDDPRSSLFDNNMHLQFAQFNEPLQITPKVGDLVLFPSWLRHWTMPTYNSESARIAFAFNVRLKGIHIEREYQATSVKEDKLDGLRILKREL